RPRQKSPTWLLASVTETPEWWPWLAAQPGVADAAGFVFRRTGALEGVVRDADAGDLDGDGKADFAAATDEDLLIFAIGPGGPALRARAALSETPPLPDAPVATRDPRTFVRIVPGAGAPGEVLVRPSAEAKTRVFGWDGGKLVRRADREDYP